MFQNLLVIMYPNLKWESHLNKNYSSVDGDTSWSQKVLTQISIYVSVLYSIANITNREPLQ